MTYREVEIELMVVQENNSEAEEAFSKLRQDYHEHRKHTDQLESIQRKREILFLEFWGW